LMYIMIAIPWLIPKLPFLHGLPQPVANRTLITPKPLHALSWRAGPFNF
jgi:hypothetical protein